MLCERPRQLAPRAIARGGAIHQRKVSWATEASMPRSSCMASLRARRKNPRAPPALDLPSRASL
ncbi:MAG: hypothetical protein C4334_15180 [Pyrinomonas sp.]